MMYEMRPGWDDLLRQVLQDATAVGDLDVACTASHHLISGLGFLGRARETIDLCDHLLAMIGPDDSPAWYAHFECARLLNLARSSERLEWVTATATAFGREHPTFRNRFQADIAAVLALLDTGRRSEARLLARAQELRGGDPSAEVYAAIAVAEVAWVDGDAGAIARCVAAGRRHGDVWWGSRALLEVLGAYASWESDAAVTAEHPVFVLPAMSPSLIEIDAVVAASAGRHAEAIARFDDAASAWTAVGAPRWSLRAQAAAAHVAALASTPDAARRATAVEHRASERELSLLLLPWARFRNGRILTPRERAVLRLVASGRTSADIARTLGISAATVNAHVASARTKTGATTRRAVVAR
jgi:DNA-binding CsgD family transcriptional regulator